MNKLLQMSSAQGQSLQLGFSHCISAVVFVGDYAVFNFRGVD